MFPSLPSSLPTVVTIDIPAWDPQNDVSVDIDIEPYLEQAADEILDDDRLQQDVIVYCTAEHSSDPDGWYTNDNFLRTCKLLRDNDEQFKAWWTQRNAERIHNRAVDLALAAYHEQPYRSGP